MPEEVDGAALETLVFQELRAVNQYFELGYGIHYWRTSHGDEVDFVLDGEQGLVAIDVTQAATLRGADFRSPALFGEDYPMAKALLVHTGHRDETESGIRAPPVSRFLASLPELLKAP